MSATIINAKPDTKKNTAKGEKISFGSKGGKGLSPAEIKQSMSGYDLRSRIQALVAGVTNVKIKHVYRGQGAATSPDIMFLPAIAQTYLFTKLEAEILLGYTAHEISHHLETDFEMIMKLFADPQRPTKKEMQVKEWWNAIEDYRIEKLTRKSYPGFPIYINKVREHTNGQFISMCEKGLLTEKELNNPYRIGAVGLTFVGAMLNAYPTDTSNRALTMLGADLEGWLRSKAGVLSKVETKDDALLLARALLDELEQASEESEDDEGDSNKSDSKKNQKNEKSDPNNQKQDKQDKKQEGKGDSEGDDLDDSSSEKDQEPGAGKPPESEDQEDTSPDQDGSPDGSSDNTEQAQSGDTDKSDNDGDDSGDDNGNDIEPEKSEQHESKENDQNQGSQPNSNVPDNNTEANADGNADTNVDTNADGTEGSQDQSQAQNNEGSTQGGNKAPQTSEEDREATPEQSDLKIEDIIEALDQIADGLYDMVEPEMSENIAGSTRTQVERCQRQYAEAKSTIGSAGARATGVMRRLLQSTNRTQTRRGLEEGRLDMGRLVPIVNGSRDIYYDRKIRQDVNSAVSILVDNSYSMMGDPLAICQKASIILDTAITGTKTDLEINGFTGSDSQPIIYQYRKFGQKGQAAAASLGKMTTVQLGGTPISVPILEAQRSLEQHKAPRKIMIIITDGAASDLERTKQAHDLAVLKGVNVLGIGIGSEGYAIKQWCSNCEVIKNIDELPQALTAIVSTALTGRKALAA